MADVELFPSSNVLNQGLYCIVDFKSLTVLPPFLAQNDEEAIRNFSNLINYSNSMLCRFPEDFKLYKIGTYCVSFTGTYDIAREDLQKYVQNYDFIASADLLIASDTIKYDELNKRVDEALNTVSNSNNVLVEQIGNVPNLSEQINLLTSKLQSLRDEFEHFKNDDKLTNAEIHKLNFFKRIFS